MTRGGLRADVGSPAMWVDWISQKQEKKSNIIERRRARLGFRVLGWTVGPVPKDPNSLAQLLTGVVWAAWHTNWGLQKGMKAVWALSTWGPLNPKQSGRCLPALACPTGLVAHSLASLLAEATASQPSTFMAFS